jgi:large conductance mechanosensitive channel
VGTDPARPWRHSRVKQSPAVPAPGRGWLDLSESAAILRTALNSLGMRCDFSTTNQRGDTHMTFATEFKEFALKGNVVDLAVGVIIGGAFGKIVDSVITDLIMPLVGLALGGLDFSNRFIPLAGQTANTLVEAKKAGAVFAYGNFITVAINFIILAFIIFLMIKQMNRMKREAPPVAAATPEDVMLLREIRDSLKK